MHKITVIAALFLFGSAWGIAAETQIPYPEIGWKTLICKWTESGEVKLPNMTSAKMSSSDMTNEVYYPEKFSMMTDGVRLWDFTLPRWGAAEGMAKVVPGFGCVSSFVSLSCNSPMFNIIIDRKTLSGLEVNYVELAKPIDQGGPNVVLSTFQCSAE